MATVINDISGIDISGIDISGIDISGSSGLLGSESEFLILEDF